MLKRLTSQLGLTGLLLILTIPAWGQGQNTFPPSGNIGIGIATPAAPLHVLGNSSGPAAIFSNAGSGLAFHIGSAGARIEGNLQLALDSAAGVGIGTLTPSAKLHVAGNTRVDGNVGIGTATATAPLHVLGNSEGPAAIFSNAGSGLAFQIGSAGARIDGRLQLATDATARVGIGTLNPSAKLHVAGDAIVDGNLAAKYQDVAEWVPARAAFPQGTVVVIDGGDGRSVLRSSQPYDPRVAGVVSTLPGILLGEAGENKVKVAHSGRVKVKVDAQYGSVAVGDLLVASPTPGYAMRSVPLDIGGTPIHRPGTLLGKALEELKEGQGEILVLLTLQ